MGSSRVVLNQLKRLSERVEKVEKLLDEVIQWVKFPSSVPVPKRGRGRPKVKKDSVKPKDENPSDDNNLEILGLSLSPSPPVPLPPAVPVKKEPDDEDDAGSGPSPSDGFVAGDSDDDETFSTATSFQLDCDFSDSCYGEAGTVGESKEFMQLSLKLLGDRPSLSKGNSGVGRPSSNVKSTRTKRKGLALSPTRRMKKFKTETGTACLRRKKSDGPQTWEPLILPPSSIVAELNPQITMKTLSSDELAQYNRRSPQDVTCKLCDSKFKLRIQLKAHLRKIHQTTKLPPGKPRKCPCCPKLMFHKGHYLKHVMTHTGERPFRCDICHLMLKTKESLTQHKSIHETGPKQKDFVCDQCQAGFTTRYVLARHIQMEHSADNVNPFAVQCPICNRGLKNKYRLKKHLRIHEDISQVGYTCHLCGQTFTTKSNMEKHIRNVDHKQPKRKMKRPVRLFRGSLPCSICGVKFTNSSNLKKHEQRHIDPSQSSRGPFKKGCISTTPTTIPAAEVDSRPSSVLECSIDPISILPD